MTTCLGRSCSLGLRCVSLSFGWDIWDLIVLVSDHCLSFYFVYISKPAEMILVHFGLGVEYNSPKNPAGPFPGETLCLLI